jgi:predicted Zn-dependent protease
MNREQAQDLIGEILEFPRAGELQVTLQGASRLGTRFNDCAISQNVLKQQVSLALTARLGQKKTSLSLNTLHDRDRIRAAIDEVFAVCAHMPEDEEVMPAPGRVLEGAEHAFCAASESLEIETLGAWAAKACETGSAAGIDLAGLLSLGRMYHAYGDSAGGFAFERSHRCDYHVTATGADGSGWAEHQGVSIGHDDVIAATGRAIDKCRRAQNPEVFQPRPTTVVLEPQAVGDLLSMAFWYGFDQRAADEGRSAFSGFDRRLGRLSLYSDPSSPVFPSVSFNSDGQAVEKCLWLDRGRLQQLQTSRFWADRQGLEPRPAPNNLLLDGQGLSIDDLVAKTADGVLVTRFWYIRSTDARTLSFTGMTRDGTYRIENGEITRPLVDMRWNESVLRVLDRVVASGAPVATGEFLPMAMPALQIENFHFSSLSGS